MFGNSIYKSKKENLADRAKDFYYFARKEGRDAVRTFDTMVFVAGDVNSRMEVANQRAFGKYRRR